MDTQHGRTYTTTELSRTLDIQNFVRVAHACGFPQYVGSGSAIQWTYHDAVLIAVARALTHDPSAPTYPHPYREAVPYARAVADACQRGHCPAYLIMGAGDWLLIDHTDNPDDADRHATDITLHLTKQGQTVRVLHLRPILDALEQP